MTETRVEAIGPVLVVTIDRPQARNALNDQVSLVIAEAMDRLDEDTDLRVAVLTGAGGCFSAGMDLKASREGQRAEIGGRGFGGLAKRPPRKPLIAAVEGFALGGGFELALACDLIVAARDARFGLPEVSRGRIAAGGSLLRLQQSTTRQVAMQLALIGEPVTGTQAADYGIVNFVCDPGAALEQAMVIARAIANNAPLAVIATKAVLTGARDWRADEAWDRQNEIAEPIRASEDAREGITAFIEKRAPQWRGQ
jgi:enoyl-CoA hydratase